MLTTDMKAQLYKQNDSPRKHTESLIKDFAFLNGVGDSTLPAMPLSSADRVNQKKAPIDSNVGDFGYNTISSTLKTTSLFKNHLHRHVDQVDGSTFEGRLTRPGEPITHKTVHYPELPEGSQAPYDNFMYSWKNA